MTMTTNRDAERASAVAAAQGRTARPIVAPGGVRGLTSVESRVRDALPRTAPAEPEVGQAEPVVPAVEPIEAVLAAAEGSAQQKLRTKAARIREQITELSNLVAVETEARKVEARVAQLREKLSAAETELRDAETELRTLRHPATTSPSTAKSTTTREVARAVRAWAQTNNIEVSAHGRVPNDLVKRWQDETGGIL